MTESMIERVAAILLDIGIDDPADNIRIARRIIEAMREPTELMHEEGFRASPHDVSGCRDQIESDDEWMADAVVSPYQAMIDAALQWPAGSADRAGVPMAED